MVRDSGGTIRGKAALRAYWTARRCGGNPDLRFDLVAVYEGVGALAGAWCPQRDPGLAELRRIHGTRPIRRIQVCRKTSSRSRSGYGRTTNRRSRSATYGGVVAPEAVAGDSSVRHLLLIASYLPRSGRARRRPATTTKQSVQAAACHQVPSTFLVCAQNREPRQRGFARRAGVVVELEAGHHPLLPSAPPYGTWR